MWAGFRESFGCPDAGPSRTVMILQIRFQDDLAGLYFLPQPGMKLEQEDLSILSSCLDRGQGVGDLII